MTDKLKELALAAKQDAPSVQRNTAVREFEEAASPDAILALIKRAEDAKADADHNKQQAIWLAVTTEDLRADLENERRKVTELVDGYEKDQAELKHLRTTIFTDNEKHIERLLRIETKVDELIAERNQLRADVERLKAQQENIVPDDVVAGALYDFLGYLTTRRTRITLSDRDNAGAAVDALVDWSKTRPIKLDEARVANWHTYLTSGTAQKENT